MKKGDEWHENFRGLIERMVENEKKYCLICSGFFFVS